MKHLSDVEQRLEQASEEVRRVAAHSVPAPIDEKGRPLPNGWIVFAAAFAAVVIAVGVLPMLSRSGDPATAVGDRSPSTTASVVTPTTLGREPTTTNAPTADCSAAGLPEPASQQGLPELVAETRRAIAAAATRCDLEALESLAPADLNTSFGGGGFENIPLWEGQGQGELGTLVKLFGTPYAVQEFEDLPDYYVWPSAFAYDTTEEIPHADLEALYSVYTEGELDQILSFGAYAGWRIGITEEGMWEFFVAGD